MKTLAGIRSGYGEDLVARAADVTLKERRHPVLLARETPLSAIHLENMLELTRMGAIVLPPTPAFYNRPASVADIVEHVVARPLDQFGLEAAHRTAVERRGAQTSGVTLVFVQEESRISHGLFGPARVLVDAGGQRPVAAVLGDRRTGA